METARFLKPLLEASWQGSLVIVLILLLRPLLGLRVPARWRYALWAVVLLRLLVPAFLLPPSPASIQNLAVVDRPLEHSGLLAEPAGTQPARADSSPALRAQGPEDDGLVSPAPAHAPKPSATPHSWWLPVTILWALGCGLTATWAFGTLATLRRRVGLDGESPSAEILALWDRCCAEAALGGKRSARPQLLQTSAVQSPALIGIFRPVLLIPLGSAADLSTEDWEHIFWHELAHFRRRDHWTQALQLLALCVHWFNPLVWLGFRALRTDRELAADEWALRGLQEHRSMAYGATLLKVATIQSAPLLAPAVVGIMEDGAQIKQRLRHIVAFTPRRFFGTALGFAVALALVAVVLGRQPDKADLTAYAGLSPAETLIVAAQRGDTLVVGQLLADGTDVNSVVNIRGQRTALGAAAAAHQSELVHLLLAKGAQVNLKPEKGDAPVVAALRNGWADTATVLIKSGAVCDPEILTAAQGDTHAIEKYLGEAHPDFERLKMLFEVAAAQSRASTLALLYDSIHKIPAQRYWTAGGGTLTSAIIRDDRALIEDLIKRDINLTKMGVNRLGAAAAKTPGMREWLNSKGFTVPEYTDNERLIDAAEREDLPAIRRLLDAGAEINYRGESGWTPITKAATWGCPRAVKLLLERGADPNSVKSPGWNYSALCLAKTPEIADMLFATGANINAKLYDRDVHIVSYCISHGSKELVQWFLDHGVDPVQAKTDEPTLLFDAGRADVAELLIERGVDIHATDSDGRSALIHILQMRTNAAPIAAVLLKHGADPNERWGNGFTPLMSASDGASVDVLVAAGANVHAKNDAGADVLSASFHGMPDRTEALLRHGARMDKENESALLTNAVLKGDLDEVKSLLAQGIDPNATTRRISQSPLAMAISNGHDSIVALLRGAGANDVGALSEAAAKGDLDRMKELLEGGADVNERARDRLVPLHFAVSRGQARAVRFLIEHGANVNCFNTGGFTPYVFANTLRNQVTLQNYSAIEGMEAAEAGRQLDDIIAAIEAQKPNANDRDENGDTALLCAARHGYSMGWSARAEGGVDLNIRDRDGMTALMLVILHQPRHASTTGEGSVHIGEANYSERGYFVKRLLEAGADINVRNNAGRTAVDLARDNGNEEVLNMVEAAAVKNPPKLPAQP